MGDTELYDILGVAPTATEQEISKAYRKLALTCHPDRGGDPDVFDRICKAKDVLSDPKSRERYDASGRTTALTVEEEFLQFFGRKGGADDKKKAPQQRQEDKPHGLYGTTSMSRQREQPVQRAPARDFMQPPARNGHASPAETVDDLSVGRRVTIIGITSRPEMNGKTGVLLHRSEDRWQVRMEEDLSEKLLKADNLCPFPLQQVFNPPQRDISDATGRTSTAPKAVAGMGAQFGQRGFAEDMKKQALRQEDNMHRSYGSGAVNRQPEQRAQRPPATETSQAARQNGASVEEELCAGMRVIVIGMTARPEMNGQTGVLVKLMDDRWQVRMEGDFSEKMLKACNLCPLQQQKGVSPATAASPMRANLLPRPPSLTQPQPAAPVAKASGIAPPPSVPSKAAAKVVAEPEKSAEAAKEQEKMSEEHTKLLQQLEEAAATGDQAGVKAARQAAKDAGLDKKDIARAFALGSARAEAQMNQPAPVPRARVMNVVIEPTPAVVDACTGPTPAAQPADPASESAGSMLDGRWLQLDSGEYMATISGSTLSWADGPGADLERPSERSVVCELFGERFSAELNEDNQLIWTDGDVWVREDLANAVEGQ